jgi:NAD(P)-dependent dehydrogenase (short-subunit alcohol dehydrogenase family)
MSLDQKVAVITGAAGIGGATARLMASRGIRVAVLSRTKEKTDRLVDSIKADGGEALSLEADVTDYDVVKRAIDRTVETYGRLDIVFANAGVNGLWAPMHDYTADDFRKVIDINLVGTFNTIHPAIPHLKRSGGGSIIITSSVNGTRMFSNSGATAYATSKAGQLALGKMLALELAPDRIRVNVVCPGGFETEIDEKTEKEDFEEANYPVDFPEGKIPLTGGKPGKAEQVARLVLFLASDDADHITGTPVWIDGAQSLLQG